MKWPLVMILLGLFVTGCCQSQPPGCDPFFGRTTIPPPPTGTIGGRPADPCYPPRPVQTPPNPCPCSPPQVQLPAPQSNPCLPMQPPVQTPSNPCPPQVQLPSQPAGQSLGIPPPAAQPPAPSGLGSSGHDHSAGFAVKNGAGLRCAATAIDGASRRFRSATLVSCLSTWCRASAVNPSTAPSASPAAPSGTSPYMPPDGSFNYRGSSTQRSTSPAAASADARSGHAVVHQRGRRPDEQHRRPHA